MQNFGRGMWRRVGDYERIQAPQIIRDYQIQQIQQYLAVMKQREKYYINRQQEPHLLVNTSSSIEERVINVPVTEEHVPVTEEPVAVTEEPVAVTEEHVAVTEEHVAVTEEHVAVTEEQVAVTEEPVAIIPKKTKRKPRESQKKKNDAKK